MEAATKPAHASANGLPAVTCVTGGSSNSAWMKFLHTDFPNELRKHRAVTCRSSVDDIEKCSEATYYHWSQYSDAFGAAPIGQAGNSVDVLKTLRVALRSSHTLAQAILDCKGESSVANEDIRQRFADWSMSSRIPLIVQNVQISVPWHLIYLGSKNLDTDSFDPVEESEHLLGMRRSVVFHAVGPDMTEREGERAKFLVTVGSGIPGFEDVGESVVAVAEVIKRTYPDAELEYLYTRHNHNKRLRDSTSDDDFWLVLCHGGQVVGPHNQPNMKLTMSEYIDSMFLDSLRLATSGSTVFTNSSCALLLSCRSGILSKDYDIPEKILNLGVTSVIAPHADISASAGLELAGHFLECLREGTLPSLAFFKAQKVGDQLTKLHSNLFTVILADTSSLDLQVAPILQGGAVSD